MSKRRFNIKAVITDKRGRVLSIGYNSYVKTHPFQAKHAEKVGLHLKTFLHAEIHAILKCRNLEKAHKISIYRFDRSGNPKIAKPCPVCQSAIEEAGIEVIEHT
jgi:deoxycytidylate deaminase